MFADDLAKLLTLLGDASTIRLIAFVPFAFSTLSSR